MDALLDEVDSLEAILMDDVKVVKNPQTGFPEIIETTVFPIVGEETDRQYICVTLQVMPQPGYPDISPKFQLIKPRGLDDYRMDKIKNACIEKLSDSIGYPVVFDLIEIIREHLTGSNLPSGQCVVCLYGFQEGDEFTKTECFHYLHSYCLARHLIASRKNYQEEQDKLPLWLKKMSDPFQATCPVCREVITNDSENLKNAKPPLELENAPDFHLTNELKELQTRMTNLYLHQKNRGAIIDLEAEDNNVISLAPGETPDETESKNLESVPSDSGLKENEFDQNVVLTNQTSAQSSSRRSNNSHQQRSNQMQRQSNNNNTAHQAAVINSSSSKYTNEESSSNNYHNRHYRRYHHHHHRSRRHHNHHFNNQNDSSHPISNNEQENSHQQQKSNMKNSYGNNTR